MNSNRNLRRRAGDGEIYGEFRRGFYFFAMLVALCLIGAVNANADELEIPNRDELGKAQTFVDTYEFRTYEPPHEAIWIRVKEEDGITREYYARMAPDILREAKSRCPENVDSRVHYMCLFRVAATRFSDRNLDDLSFVIGSLGRMSASDFAEFVDLDVWFPNIQSHGQIDGIGASMYVRDVNGISYLAYDFASNLAEAEKQVAILAEAASEALFRFDPTRALSGHVGERIVLRSGVPTDSILGPAQLADPIAMDRGKIHVNHDSMDRPVDIAPSSRVRKAD